MLVKTAYIECVNMLKGLQILDEIRTKEDEMLLFSEEYNKVHITN